VAQVPVFNTPGTGWSSFIPRHWVVFSSPPSTRMGTVEVIEPASTQRIDSTSPVQSSKLLLAFASTVVLGFGPRRGSLPYSCSFETLTCFKTGSLFWRDERSDYFWSLFLYWGVTLLALTLTHSFTPATHSVTQPNYYFWLYSPGTDRTGNIFSIIACYLVAGETTCPQSCFVSCLHSCYLAVYVWRRLCWRKQMLRLHLLARCTEQVTAAVIL
jgi:hypothetical protein